MKFRPNTPATAGRRSTSGRLLPYTGGPPKARTAQGQPFPLLDETATALRATRPVEALHALHTRVVRHSGQPLATTRT